MNLEQNYYLVSKQNYSVSDLVHDSSFRRMAKGTASTEEIDKWSRWIEASDNNREKAKEALAEIAGFKFASPDVPSSEEQWNSLKKQTLDGSNKQFIGMARKDSSVRWVFRAVAAIMLIGLLGVGTYFYSETKPTEPQLEQITKEVTVRTSDNQQKTLRFRNDQKEAEIFLNSNSSLTYEVGVIQGKSIKVTLNGEAYFDVEKGYTTDQPAFSISTPDGIIEDFGTEFLVTVENNRSRVILQEGLVEVKSLNSNTFKKKFEVTEGEKVEFREADVISRNEVNSTFYTSWATGYMKFDETRIEIFAQYLEQRFDVKVKIQDQDLSKITLDGAIYFKSLEGLVRSVSETAKIPIYQSANRDTVYIGDISNSN